MKQLRVSQCCRVQAKATFLLWQVRRQHRVLPGHRLVESELVVCVFAIFREQANEVEVAICIELAIVKQVAQGFLLSFDLRRCEIAFREVRVRLRLTVAARIVELCQIERLNSRLVLLLELSFVQLVILLATFIVVVARLDILSQVSIFAVKQFFGLLAG